MTATAEHVVGSVVDGRYRVLGHLGRGGQAVVLCVEHMILKRPLALKISHATAANRVRRVLNEAELLARIDHPTIIRIYDAGVLADGRPFTVCELVDGATLEELVDGGRCDLQDALEVIAVLSDAADTLHRMGIIHRDLKPSNVLIPTDRGAPAYALARLIDFGVLGHLDKETGVEQRATRSGRTSGTALFSAPEQASGRAQTPATDVFALAAMLFSFLYGHPPMVPAGTISLFSIECAGERLDLPMVIDRLTAEIDVPERADVPSDVRRVLEKALRNDPSERMQSAGELRDELRSCLRRVRNETELGV
jgi:serine/threonine-protein kinase